jgi:hypothetical protein
MLNTIPGTDLSLPSPWDLLQAGLTSRDWVADYVIWIRAHHGEAALLDWWQAGCPQWTKPPAPPADTGVMRQGWGRTQWATGRHYRV